METTQDIKIIQDRLLNMAVTIRDILSGHNLPYIITYGTLLGAVRHKGFIPWDDDFDFAIFDRYYDQTISALRSELPPDLFLEDEQTEPLFFHDWPHIKDLNSEADYDLFPQDGLYSHKGISVDLYRTCEVSLDKAIDFRKRKYDEYLTRKLHHKLITLPEYEKLKEDMFAFASKNNYSGNQQVFFMAPRYKDPLNIDDFFPLREYTFCGEKFLGPTNPDRLLETWYGKNFMSLPPEKDRESHYTKVVFNDMDLIYNIKTDNQCKP